MLGIPCLTTDLLASQATLCYIELAFSQQILPSSGSSIWQHAHTEYQLTTVTYVLVGIPAVGKDGGKSRKA